MNGSPDNSRPRLRTFSTLFAAEQEFLERAAKEEQSGAKGPGDPPADSIVEGNELKYSAEEPWIERVSHDRVGLGLSGGGIRSATFNLGLLQALQEDGLLSKVDYLSTVSGGGYIGSFWTRWRKDRKELFPTPKAPAAAKGEGYYAIRHLREFSRFLIPRIDLFETELWTALGKVFGGLVFGIVLGLSAIAAIVLLWAFVAQTMLYINTPMQSTGSLFLFSMILSGTFFWSEHLAFARGKVEATADNRFAYAIRAILIGIFVIAGWLLAIAAFHPPASTSFLPGIKAYSLTWRNFTPSILLVGVFLLVSFWRLLPRNKAPLAVTAAYDRITARLFFLAVMWAALAGLWELSAYLRNLSAAGRTAPDVSFFGGTSAVLAMVFAGMRKWIVGTQEDRLKGGFKKSLKNVLPNVIATIAVLFLAITITMAVMDVAEYFRFRSLPLSAVCIPWLVLLATILLIDPKALSLHEFYRARLTRCYLGAANPDAQRAAENRHTFERAKDDLKLSEAEQRPIHLICCAANTVGEDRLSTLYRGARSAVLSRFGIAIADASADADDLMLSSALTASGAAFNSNMGRKSILYGRASCFLMTMLNMRLGLWVRHPQARAFDDDWFDTSFIRELFGWTRCENVATVPALHKPSLVHLSDGGHFENLGLYELVRRHCRFVIVSDSAADPNYSFGDLANAVRRIREDFGIEVEIETDPLRPQANGFSAQHMVVGTIHYDGRDGIDKGVLLFFKPVLTGDEPTDILEYRRANHVFPQQSTGDQFYSEAQWESYRRLGEHAMHTQLKELSIVERSGSAQKVFRSARLDAEKLPWCQDDRYLQISSSCNELETFFRQTAPAPLLNEFFPELAANAKPSPATHETLFALLRILQTLEEIAEGCDLYNYWSHPLASGWMNYLHRWTNLPTLRSLWPLVKPLYASSFTQFLEKRCGLKSRTSLNTEFINYSEQGVDWAKGLAAEQWVQEEPQHEVQGKSFFGLKVTLSGVTAPIQVGMACIAIANADATANWNWDDLYVANALRGGGFTGRLLDALLTELQRLRCKNAVVRFEGRDLRESSNRRQIVELVDFYRSRGFRWQSDKTMIKELTN